MRLLSYQNYGTDIYRFDCRDSVVIKTHNSYHRVAGLAFSPTDPELISLALSLE